MRNRNTQGFTLIELLIVIAIIGILAAVLIPNLLSARATAVDRSAEAFARNVLTAVTAEVTETLNTDLTAIEGDCSTATYVPITGSAYTVDEPGFNWDTATPICEVTVDSAGNVQVDGTYLGGNLNSVSVGSAGTAVNTVP